MPVIYVKCECGSLKDSRARRCKGCVLNFWDRVKKTSKCWLWNGVILSTGYGQYRTKRNRRIPPHRYVWEITFGPIPKGLCVLHKCDVRNCVRPSHLFLGTKAENVWDCIQKGRFPLSNLKQFRRI